MENQDKKNRTAAAKRRQQAAAIAREKSAQQLKNLEALSPEAMRQTLHELRVHQIELEMQNEELCRAQVELDAARARYFDLYDLAPVGYCTLSEPGLILEANLTAATLLGVARGALVKQPITRFIFKEDQDLYYRRHQQLFKTGEPQVCELRMLKNARTAFWALLQATVAPAAEGARIYRVVLNDITGHKRVEEALRESEGKLRLITDNVPAIVAYVSAQDLRYRFVNQVYADMFGHFPEQMIGKQVSEVLGAEAYARALPYIDRARAGERILYDNLVPVRGEQRWFNIRYVPKFDEQGAVRNIVVMAVDITERKQAEEALRQSEERFRKLFERHSAVKLIIEADTGKIIDANEAASNFYGWSIEELRRMHIQQINTLTPEALKVEMEKAGSSQVTRFEFHHRRADGSIRQVEVFSNQIEIAGKALLYSIIHDITERKRAEAEKEKLEVQNRQLQKSESLGRMAGAIAHHFNNQLQAVMMNLETAMNDLPRNAGSVENLAEAMQAVRKAAEVSSLMLTYLGQTQCIQEPLDLSDTCLRSLSLLRASIPKSMVLETDLPSPGPAIRASANQIQQVLTNLATNAWEATSGRRGTIRLTVKTVSGADIPAVNRFPIDFQPQDTAYACLNIADTGCGIPDKDIEKLFDPFYSSKFTGRGMGLAVVLGIVRAHRGAVTVESEPGRGSVFRVFLPVSAEAVPRKSVQVTQALSMDGSCLSTGHAQGGTVLVVEDELIVRKALTLALKRSGFTVLAAADGVEAVELFRQHQTEIRLVLSDLTMPRMDGWETLTALRKLAPGIPVILASGYSEAQVMEGYHPELPQVFLRKPYDHEALCCAISQVLANQKNG